MDAAIHSDCSSGSRICQIKDNFLSSKRQSLRLLSSLTAAVTYAAYYGYALYYDFSNNLTLFIITSVAMVCILIHIIQTSCKNTQTLGRLKLWSTKASFLRVMGILRWALHLGVLVGVSIFIIVDARHQPSRLISGGGLLAILFTAFLFSSKPSKIAWGSVVSGLCVQVLLGLIVLRWPAGCTAFRWLGRQVATFLSYSDVGAAAVFGENFRDHSTALQSMPVAIYFGAVSSILYYLGALQVVIRAVGHVIQVTMGTGTIESFIAASNIFLGPTESVLTVAPFLSQMTKSELHAVLTCGFSTISGGVLAIYISFGVSPSHLVTASVMSAPAALAVSRILLPETEVSRIAKASDIVFEKSKDRNLLHAASSGASGCVRIVGYILSNMLAFTAGLQFLNMTLTWFGSRVGVGELTVQRACGWLLWPLAFLLGVEAADCAQAGQLIASAIVLNSFFSYIDLSKLIQNRKAGKQPALSPRSETIVTYAVCNFANFGSIGMNLGALGAMAPSRQTDLAEVALRAVVAGNMASFMTACMSGLLVDE